MKMVPSVMNDRREENDLKKVAGLLSENYKLFVLVLFVAIGLAFLLNKFSLPAYKISSSILIREKSIQPERGDAANYLNSSLIGKNQNFQNELWVLKSSPVIEQTIANLDLTVSYYSKKGFQYVDAYKTAPFKIIYLRNHPQPVGIRFKLTFLSQSYFLLEAESGKASFYNFETGKITHKKEKWHFRSNGNFDELIQTEDMAFIVQRDTTCGVPVREFSTWGFNIRTISSLGNEVSRNMNFMIVDRLATVIEIDLKINSEQKGIDILNEMMNVYSGQNLSRKNHIASITIDYIEKQLAEITDSLNRTEENLQRFRSSNQLLNLTEQANGISEQYMDLQNQLAELLTRKRYYDYVAGYIEKNDSYSNMIVPASIGISDPLLNNLMQELITAQSQRSNLIENNQEKNPLVQKLTIRIENTKKTISDNIAAVVKTTTISIDEMNKRISKIEGEISRIPLTQRKLGTIERKFRLNDAIYNYLLEKHAEAKITKASNLPDEIIIEPARMVGLEPVSPNKKLNYLIALVFGIIFPFGYLTLKTALNNKVETQEDIELITDRPLLGIISHNTHKSSDVMLENTRSNIAESFRSLRTNLDFYVRSGHKKVILITSSIEREGKTFVAKNLAMSYAQLGRKTILVNFDLRKPGLYFDKVNPPEDGLSSYLINKCNLQEIIRKSPHEKLDFIHAGILPPNPAELIALEKTEKLLAELRSIYDIIILDTAPLAQVTDAYLLIHHAELKVIVVRQNYTLKKIFSLILKDLQLKKVTNVCVVLNDNRVYTNQYGYGYGYNNGKEVKKKKNGIIAGYSSAAFPKQPEI